MSFRRDHRRADGAPPLGNDVRRNAVGPAAASWRFWESDLRMAGDINPEPPELTAIWMPTARLGDRPVPRAGVMGFSVLKQIPYQGDAHTDHAMQVALFLTHPVHLARSQVREFRHLPPDAKAFGEIYPELMHNDDPWVKFYNQVMDSDVPIVPGNVTVGDRTLIKRAEWPAGREARSMDADARGGVFAGSDLRETHAAGGAAKRGSLPRSEKRLDDGN